MVLTGMRVGHAARRLDLKIDTTWLPESQFPTTPWPEAALESDMMTSSGSPHSLFMKKKIQIINNCRRPSFLCCGVQDLFLAPIVTYQNAM